MFFIGFSKGYRRIPPLPGSHSLLRVEKVILSRKNRLRLTCQQSLTWPFSKTTEWIFDWSMSKCGKYDQKLMTEIVADECERCRVFAAIEWSRHVRDTSATHRRQSGNNSWQSENEVKHYTCFISALVRAIRIYPLCGGRTHFFG